MKKALKTRKLVAEKFPENLVLQNKLGVGYIMANELNEAKDVFRQVLNGTNLLVTHKELLFLDLFQSFLACTQCGMIS